MAKTKSLTAGRSRNNRTIGRIFVVSVVIAEIIQPHTTMREPTQYTCLYCTLSFIIMCMPIHPSVILGKALRSVARIRGGGSALPGLFVEKIDPDFMKRTLLQLEHGVVLISGTNGKTTTTKMVVELFESQGLKVFTNRTGSNFTRGVAASLLGEVTMGGKLGSDIAVLELDEAHAVHFVKAIPPRYSLLLNVMRDQLDRFGEIDNTAKLLQKVALATTNSVVVNREDPRLVNVAASLPAKTKIEYFGLSQELTEKFPSDDTMRGEPMAREASKIKASAVLESLQDHTANYTIESHAYSVTLKLDGVYNIYNAVAAACLVKTVLGKSAEMDKLNTALADIKPAFGRGEIFTVNEQPLELVLVKNPGGFRLGLSSFQPQDYATMIAINDNYADGRDMSWLWDVDFDSLRKEGVAVVSGIRAYDMALRLQYEAVDVAVVETSLPDALAKLLKNHTDKPKRIYCTYTAMLALRKLLTKHTTVEDIS